MTRYGITEGLLPIEQRSVEHIEVRCTILRACMAGVADSARPGHAEHYLHWRAELDELEAELTARDVAAEVNGCTCGDAYDSRIVDVPRCDYCTKGIVQRQAADYRLNAPPRF